MSAPEGVANPAGVTAWFQCLAGASGDMLLGALLDAGAPLEVVQGAVDAVGVGSVRISVETVERGGLGGLKADVHTGHTSVVRTWPNVRGLLEAADLPEPVRARATDVFDRMARAEGQAHRISPEQVHFHEVGALDAIADVVGVSAALHALGISDVVCSSVALGSGMVRSGHGMLPVPGPAVLALLAEVGAPVYSGDEPFELCTPTGAALLASCVSSWGPMPAGTILATGYGAGTRELESMPNLLRVALLDPSRQGAGDSEPETELVIETNVDDLDPRLWPAVLVRLLDAGAADAWLTPVLMKKGRPAHVLSVLVDPPQADAVRRVIVTETSTIGTREHLVTKRALERGFVTVQVDGQPVRVKTASFEGVVVNVQPEYEDVMTVAENSGRPVKAVLAAAVAAAHAAGIG